MNLFDSVQARLASLRRLQSATGSYSRSLVGRWLNRALKESCELQGLKGIIAILNKRRKYGNVYVTHHNPR
jgi:hypothetical protein